MLIFTAHTNRCVPNVNKFHFSSLKGGQVTINVIKLIIMRRVFIRRVFSSAGRKNQEIESCVLPVETEKNI